MEWRSRSGQAWLTPSLSGPSGHLACGSGGGGGTRDVVHSLNYTGWQRTTVCQDHPAISAPLSHDRCILSVELETVSGLDSTAGKYSADEIPGRFVSWMSVEGVYCIALQVCLHSDISHYASVLYEGLSDLVSGFS